MHQINRVGRPWGGICWFIKKNIQIISHEILEDGISYLEIKHLNHTLSLLGTYLTSLSPKLENKIKYEAQLLILKEKIISCKMENKRFFIIGDMNRDIQRNRYYTDQKLGTFIQEINCVSIENSNRNIDYSFYKMNYNSLIDHLITDRNDRSSKMKIENAKENTSDHLALIIEIKTGDSEMIHDNIESEEIKADTNINWNNGKSVEIYENILNDKLKKVKFNNIFLDEEDPKVRIDEYYFSLKEAFVEAHN